ncbi:MAG: hypothetical protein IMZ70_08400 [Candidatus Atribacteria bacterium]|nr:hypothetical protein [Candidatus Atribacteria bacterium]
MAKKKENSRVQPGVKSPNILVDYADLNDGDAFIHEKRLFIKFDYDDQEGVALDEDGGICYDMCGEMVLPVDIKIMWTKKG